MKPIPDEVLLAFKRRPPMAPEVVTEIIDALLELRGAARVVCDEAEPMAMDALEDGMTTAYSYCVVCGGDRFGDHKPGCAWVANRATLRALLQEEAK